MADNPRIEDLRRRVQKDPASIAFAQLAEEYRRAGLHQESVDACRAGLALHPGYLSARVTLGRVLIELGQFDDAQTELNVVLKTAPENLAAIRGIADIQYKRGNFADALEFYQTALGLARNDPELEQIVTELTRQVKPTKRPDLKDGLSLDDMHRELTARAAQHMTPRPMPVPRSAANPQPPAPKPVLPPAAVPSPVAAPPAAAASVMAPAPAVTPVPSAPLPVPAAAPPLAAAAPAAAVPSVTVLVPPVSVPPAAPAFAASSAPSTSFEAYDPEATVMQKAPAFLRRPPQVDPGQDQSLKTVAALEKWLDALNVTRSQRVS